MPEPTEPPEQQPTGRQRLVESLRRPRRGQLVAAVILAVVGFAGITQVHANSADNSYTGYRQQDLLDLLSGLAGTTQRAQSELRRLETTRDGLRTDTSRREAALEQAKTEADTLAILAGLVPVTGPGIRVTITEAADPVPVDDLVDMVQELRTAGAEAIAFNAQVRVVAQTAFEQNAGGIAIDGQQLSAPYVVDVIGDPDTLAVSGMGFAQGPTYRLTRDGAEVTVDRLTSVDIETVRQPSAPEYAVPQDAQ